MSPIPTIKLNDGTSMPQFGFGTWKATSEGEAYEAVRVAIKSGYRLIDCAHVYCNEEEVGRAISECIAEGIVKREDLYVVTKLWNTHHSKEHVEPAIRKSLERLKLDYLNLYLVHFPVSFEFTGYDYESLVPADAEGVPRFGKASIQETWTAMEQLVDAGLTRSIGVSNFKVIQLLDLLTYARITPAVNQIEVHPFYSRVKYVKELQRRGIAIMAYSPLGSGKGILSHPKLIELSEKIGHSVGQILLRYSIQRGLAPIPKSSNASRIAENIDIFNFTLSDEVMELLGTLNEDRITCSMQEYWNYDIDM